MNIEFEVKALLLPLLGGNGTKEQIAERICNIANFSKESVMKGIYKGGENVADIYGNIIAEDKNERRN